MIFKNLSGAGIRLAKKDKTTLKTISNQCKVLTES